MTEFRIETSKHWRWDGPNRNPGCTCPCDTCIGAVGYDPEEPCPYCPVHGHLTDDERQAEWANRTREGTNDDHRP